MDTLFDTAPTTQPDTSVDTTEDDRLGCPCPTPWDPQTPPTLYIASGTGKNATTHHTIEFAVPGRPRNLANGWLTRAGHLKMADWEYRTGKTPYWQTTLNNGWVARLTDPNAKHTTGYHCPDCHRHFNNEAAANLHKPPTTTAIVDGRTVKLPGPTDWRNPCIDPATVRHIEHGTPLMYLKGGERIEVDLDTVAGYVRTQGGVWTVNPGAVWPAGVAPLPPTSHYMWLPWKSHLADKPPADPAGPNTRRKRPLCKMCSEVLSDYLYDQGIRRHTGCAPRRLWAQEDYDARPLHELPHRPCPGCHHKMVVYEAGQEYHPGCEPNTPRRTR